MTRKGDLMRSGPTRVYTNDPECLVIVYDLNQPDGPAALQRQRDALAGYTNVEELAENRIALIVHPGWVSRSVA